MQASQKVPDTITLDRRTVQSIRDELSRVQERFPAREVHRTVRLLTEALAADRHGKSTVPSDATR